MLTKTIGFGQASTPTNLLYLGHKFEAYLWLGYSPEAFRQKIAGSRVEKVVMLSNTGKFPNAQSFAKLNLARYQLTYIET